MSFNFYRILDNPLIFNLCQTLLAPGATYLLNKHYKFIFQDSRGSVLDVGCGPKLTTPKPEGKITGLDISLRYIKDYTRDPSLAGVVGSADHLPFKDNSFDETRCFGLLHHLPDDMASSMVREMVRCTRGNGHIIVLESVWPLRPFRRPFAYLNHRFDRGQWVRHRHELSNLVRTAYPGEWQSRIFTYTFVGHELLMLKMQKPA